MKMYEVVGPVARLGVGDLVSVDAQQLASRKHNVEIVKAGKRRSEVKAKTTLEFKAGEEIGLPDLPKHLIDVCVPRDGQKAEADKQKAETDKQKPETDKVPAPDKPRSFLDRVLGSGEQVAQEAPAAGTEVVEQPQSAGGPAQS